MYETYWTTIRGVETMDSNYRLLDFTHRLRAPGTVGYSSALIAPLVTGNEDCVRPRVGCGLIREGDRVATRGLPFGWRLQYSLPVRQRVRRPPFDTLSRTMTVCPPHKWRSWCFVYLGRPRRAQGALRGGQRRLTNSGYPPRIRRHLDQCQSQCTVMRCPIIRVAQACSRQEVGPCQILFVAGEVDDAPGDLIDAESAAELRTPPRLRAKQVEHARPSPRLLHDVPARQVRFQRRREPLRACQVGFALPSDGNGRARPRPR